MNERAKSRVQKVMADPNTTEDRHICDYPVCSERGAGHPLACNCRSTSEPSKSQTTTCRSCGGTGEKRFAGIVASVMPEGYPTCPECHGSGHHDYSKTTIERISARDAIANCLLMGRGAYETPEAWAEAVLKRLDHEGYRVVCKEPGDPWHALQEIIDNA